MHSRAIAGTLAPDSAVHDNALRGREIHDVAPGGRPLARGEAPFADRASRQIGSHGNTGPAARTSWHSGRVIRIARLSAPETVLKVVVGHHFRCLCRSRSRWSTNAVGRGYGVDD